MLQRGNHIKQMWSLSMEEVDFTPEEDQDEEEEDE